MPRTASAPPQPPLLFYSLDGGAPLRPMPFFAAGARAGFPSPAGDYLQNQLDLNEHLIQHPAATFIVRVQGDSMVDANLNDGDLLLVDRSVQARNRHIVLAMINGEFTVKRLVKSAHGVFLKPENKAYKAIEVTEGMDFEVWGVVTHIIHKAD